MSSEWDRFDGRGMAGRELIPLKTPYSSKILEPSRQEAMWVQRVSVASNKPGAASEGDAEDLSVNPTLIKIRFRCPRSRSKYKAWRKMEEP